MASAQASGGQITRKRSAKVSSQASGGQIKRQQNSNNRSKSSVKNSTKETAINVAISEDGKKIKYETTQSVDLGLSSGTIWAGWNIGATSPEGIGEYFAWGEVSPKYNYDWNTYFDTEKVISGNGPVHFKKYHVNGLKSIIGTEHDAAKINWGGAWKMPTKTQLEELIQECEFHRVKLKGQDEYKYIIFVGPNGKSIIFPMVGEMYKTELRETFLDLCWSGELCPSTSLGSQNSLFAYVLTPISDNPGIGVSYSGFRFMGRNIRAVRDNTSKEEQTTRTHSSTTIQPIIIGQLAKYNIVVATFGLLSNAQSLCKELKEKGWSPQIFFENNYYRVIMVVTNDWQEAISYRDKAKQEVPFGAPWILSVDNGHTKRL